ncbi:MAG: hypothetical protein J6D20_07790 [Clostridia bacterium]|nr:hypothetical protein [Clostridia bacterium]
MKKLFLAMLVLALTIFTMASCSDNDDDKKKCDHPEDKIVEVEAKKADCFEAGYTAGKMCTKCGKAVEGMTPIAAYNHVGTTVKIPAIAATCESAGQTEGARCNACLTFVKESTIIPKLAHTEVANAEVPATCTKAGSTGGTHCSVCYNTIKEPTIVPPTGEHTLEVTKEAKAATCQETGLTAEQSCKVCGNVIEKQIETQKDPDVHVYEWKVDENDNTIENGTCPCGATTTRPAETTTPEEGTNQ